MTKEEAIETIKDICPTTEQLTRIEKALECLLSQPSLPSNIDEVTMDFARELDFFLYSSYTPERFPNSMQVGEHKSRALFINPAKA